MAETVVSNYQIRKNCRLVHEKIQIGHSKSPGANLGKYKVSVSFQFTTTNPIRKPDSGELCSVDSDLFVELAIVVDWRSAVDPDPSGTEAPDAAAIGELGNSIKRFSGYYFSGSASKLVESIDGNKSIYRFCGGDSSMSSNAISLQLFEDALVSKFADMVLIHPSAGIADVAAYWHVMRVCSIPLQAATLFHRLSPFPLLHTGHDIMLDLVTNIDRNSLIPSFAEFDALVVALLTKISARVKPEQRWSWLALDEYIIKQRVRELAVDTRLEYEKAACELLLRQFQRELHVVHEVSPAYPLSFVTLLQVYQERPAGGSANSKKRDMQCHVVDVGSVLANAATGESRLVQAAKITTLSKFPRDGDGNATAPLAKTSQLAVSTNSVDEDKSSSTPPESGLIPPASPAAVSRPATPDKGALYDKAKRKFTQLLHELPLARQRVNLFFGQCLQQ